MKANKIFDCCKWRWIFRWPQTHSGCVDVDTVVRPSDILVGGLMFYRNSSSSFFFFSPRILRARWTELNQNRPHGWTWVRFENACPNVGYPLVLPIGAQWIWRDNSVADGSIWTRFCRQMQNDMPMVPYKSEPEVEFHLGGRLFSQTGTSNISADDWDITPKFFYAGRCQPSHLSNVTKTETGSRIAMPWPPSWKKIWRHNCVADVPIWIKFSRQMQSDMYAKAAWRALCKYPNWPCTCP